MGRGRAVPDEVEAEMVYSFAPAASNVPTDGSFVGSWTGDGGSQRAALSGCRLRSSVSGFWKSLERYARRVAQELAERASERRMLNGVCAGTIPLDLLLSGKQMTRKAPDEAVKDRVDVQALAAAQKT